MIKATIAEIPNTVLETWFSGSAPDIRAEFRELFGREPDVQDRLLGVANAVEFARLLRGRC